MADSSSVRAVIQEEEEPRADQLLENAEKSLVRGRREPLQSHSLSWDNFDYAAIKLNVNEVNGIIELHLDF